MSIGGSSLPAVRVDLNPDAMSQYGLSLDSVRTAIAAANSNGPKGAVEKDDKHWQVDANDQLRKAREYEPLVIHYNTDNGAAVRLGDVAKVSDSVEDVRNAGFSDDLPAVLLIVTRQPGANIIEATDAIHAQLPVLQELLGPQVKLNVMDDRSPSIRASLEEAELTLLISVALVILVVFLFLRNGRATDPQPGGAGLADRHLCGHVPVRLQPEQPVADGADHRHRLRGGRRHRGGGEHRPTHRGGRSADPGGDHRRPPGRFHRAVDDALAGRGVHPAAAHGRPHRTAVPRVRGDSLGGDPGVPGGILTLTPMLCARLLRPLKRPEGASLARRSDRFFAAFMLRYRASLGWALEHSRLMVVIMLACIAMNLWLFVVVPKGFLPQQDSGRLRGYAVADQSISFQSLSAKMGEYRKILSSDPAVENVVGFIGGGRWQSSNTGSFFVTLKPIGERDPVEKVLTRLRERIAKVPGAALYLNAGQDVRLGGRDSNAQYEFTLRSDDLTLLREWAPKVEAAMRKLPQLVDVNSDSQDKGVQTRLVIDRDRAATLGINVEMVDAVLNDSFGQRQVSTIFNPLNQYRVVMEVDQQYQQSPEILRQVQVIGNDGQRVPLSAFSHYEPSRAPLEVNHQGQFAATTLSFNLAPGAQIGPTREAIMQALEPLHIPVDVQTSFEGNAGAVQDTQNQMPWLILLALLAVYIVLGILYESYVHPLTILSTLPSAGVGALLALILCRSELSLIALIGIILLIGIVKKNAIMMIDFALEAERNHGLSPREAILEACMMRFRPIMMTTLAALLGALPLIFGIGGDAALRRPLGITIVGGLIGSQLLTLYTTPVVYLYLDRLRHWVNQKRGVRTDGALETPL